MGPNHRPLQGATPTMPSSFRLRTLTLATLALLASPALASDAPFTDISL